MYGNTYCIYFFLEYIGNLTESPIIRSLCSNTKSTVNNLKRNFNNLLPFCPTEYEQKVLVAHFIKRIIICVF